jgi:ketosteroid isomerase-like protein
VDPDVRCVVHGTGPAARTYVGHTAYLREIVRPLSARLTRQVSPRIRDVAAANDVVIGVWTGESTARDGALYQNEYVWVFRMRETKATAIEVFLDLDHFDDVLRRVEPAGAGAR